MYKRLQTVKYLIISNNYEELELELNMLEQENETGEHNLIIEHIRTAEFNEAISLIDKHLQAKEKIQKRHEGSLTGLQTVENIYKIRHSVLFYKKTDIRKLINSFRVRHNREIGTLMAQILKLRKEILFKEYKSNPKQETAWREAERDQRRFEKSFSKAEKEAIPHIKSEEKKRLQKTFRKASKLCHPDMVADDFKEQAQEIFVELQRAYFFNNVERVKEILDLLEKHEYQKIGRTNQITEKHLLIASITKLENDVKRLKAEISELEQSEVFRTIKDINNWDSYFEELQIKFENELTQLKNKYEQL